jgi:hypothetical protein
MTIRSARSSSAILTISSNGAPVWTVQEALPVERSLDQHLKEDDLAVEFAGEVNRHRFGLGRTF